MYVFGSLQAQRFTAMTTTNTSPANDLSDDSYSTNKRKCGGNVWAEQRATVGDQATSPATNENNLKFCARRRCQSIFYCFWFEVVR
jgi:hypothetical protein